MGVVSFYKVAVGFFEEIFGLIVFALFGLIKGSIKVLLALPAAVIN